MTTVVLVLVGLGVSVRIVQQYQRGCGFAWAGSSGPAVVFPAPLMSTIQELGTFLAREHPAATPTSPTAADTPAPDGQATNRAPVVGRD